MRWIAFVPVVAAAVAAVGAYMAPASGQADEEAAPYLQELKFLQEFRDWRLISVNHLEGAGGKLKQVRAQLGNEIAIKAFQERKLPFS